VGDSTRGHPVGLRVELLGGFRAEVDGHPVPDAAWRLRRARNLVALLALAPSHRLHRDHVIDALWPDEPSDARLNGLHQVLHVARRALDPDRPRRFLQLRAEVLSLASEPVGVDVAELEAAAVQARAAPTHAAWTRILDTATRELLPESRYEEWVAQRNRDLDALRAEAAAALQGATPATAAAADIHPELPAAHNLPVYLSSFVGRHRNLDELAERLAGVRLLTLSGPGGAGKTRLATELARRVADAYAGAWFADLAAVSDSSLVLTAIAEALSVRPRPGDPLLVAVTSRLSQGPSLLLLDNCEHLLDACAEYTETLLRDCPG
jgi:hypothetical protein